MAWRAFTVPDVRVQAAGCPGRVGSVRRPDQTCPGISTRASLAFAGPRVSTVHRGHNAGMSPRARPQVVAHRGASYESAEHTLGAYLRALEQGAGALECDVRLTADGHLVCVHDRDLRRTASNRRVVSTMELAELDQLDFASWKNPWADLDDEAPDRDPERDGVL